MKKAQKNIMIAVAGALVFAVFVWLAKPSDNASGGAGSGATTSSSGPSALVAAEKSYNFGTVSMAAGKVTRMFQVKNSGDKDVNITKLYTSCMCTTASLVTADGKRGPFGMPGHSSIPAINVPVKAGEEVSVEVTYDPAAHGPAGIGRIQRNILLENDAGDPVVLEIAANVTP